MQNPLLAKAELPLFSQITPDQVEPAIDDVLTQNRSDIEKLLEDEALSADQFLLQLQQCEERLSDAWSPVSHLNGVKNSEPLREAYENALPKLTAYATELGQNKPLYEAFKAHADSEAFADLDTPAKTIITNSLRDFLLSGIALSSEKQQRYGEIQQQLAQLCTQFSNNVLDATHGWSKSITDAEELKGVPEQTLQGYAEAASAKDKEGYLISLDIPAYLPLMQYAENRELRREMYEAYATRASEMGPNAGQWDNSELMVEILALRQELAKLLGFENYAACSLATKMADKPSQVIDFLLDLAEKSQPVAKRDYEELEAFAREQGLDQLEAWDIPFYSEKLRMEKYAISQQELKPYFPVATVIQGMFAVVKRLFNISIEQVETFDSWHSDVTFYDIKIDDKKVAGFYLDLFAREHKRGGAWMANCKNRYREQDGSLQLPVAYLTCNFTAPTSSTPSLLTHDEVTTLFHEFGHGLHHMLTQIDRSAVSGISGVEWDAVELPSQFLENWCWAPEAIPLISGHYETGEALPQEMLDKLLAAKNFQSGMQMVRQIEFALFDFRIHSQEIKNSQEIQKALDTVREKVAVYPVPSFNRFQHSFGHIFAGGYAAGYYSYKWAEVLSADAFDRFEKEGIFNQEVGKEFLQNILYCGGSEPAKVLFERFRGREPEIEALLRHSGIVS